MQYIVSILYISVPYNARYARNIHTTPDMQAEHNALDIYVQTVQHGCCEA